MICQSLTLIALQLISHTWGS